MEPIFDVLRQLSEKNEDIILSDEMFELMKPIIQKFIQVKRMRSKR